MPMGTKAKTCKEVIFRGDKWFQMNGNLSTPSKILYQKASGRAARQERVERVERVAMGIHTAYPNTATNNKLSQLVVAVVHQAFASAFHREDAHSGNIEIETFIK